MLRFFYPVQINTEVCLIFENRYASLYEKRSPRQTPIFLRQLYKFVRKILLCCICLFSALCPGKDKDFQQLQDSLKRELKKHKHRKVCDELMVQDIYLDSLHRSNYHITINDYHQEIYYDGNKHIENTIIVQNKSDEKTLIQTIIDFFVNVKKIIESIVLCISIMFKSKWKRKLKLFSSPLWKRWFRRKLLNFYNFLL